MSPCCRTVSAGRTRSCCRSRIICSSARAATSAITRCECGHSFGDYRKNWKLKAAIIVRNTEESLREIYPNSDIPDPQWMEIREFICPECGTLHEVEAAAPGYPIVHDFEPDLEGFYREWLGQTALGKMMS